MRRGFRVLTSHQRAPQTNERANPAREPLGERARRGLRWLAFFIAAALVTGAGCSRDRYRLRADNEVYSLVDAVADDPRWPLPGYDIQPAPESRLFDPTDPDRPPLPPDDPAAHQLMHYVDGKRGWPHWHRNGDLAEVDFRRWMAFLQCDEDGNIPLDRDAAVRVALVNSRQYQQNLETLYLSALDVTFERFRFDAQFFGGTSTFYTADGRVRGGGESRSTLQHDTNLSVQKLNPLGGEFVAGIANSMVWQFAGPDTNDTRSIFDFNLVQPLLRFGGRARILERLTVSERALLANVRQMERYRRGFYVEAVSGRNSGPGPSRRGGFFGGAGLEGFTGIGGGGFGTVGNATINAGGAQGGTSGGAGAQEAGGFLGLLQDQQQIRNQEANVAALVDSLDQLEASYEAGRIDRFQVDLAQQALFNTQSQLLNRRAAYQTSLDTFKIRMGLPPDVPFTVVDPLLKPFELIDPDFATVQTETTALLNRARDPDREPDAATLRILAADAEAARTRIEAQLRMVEQDFKRLTDNADERVAWLERIRKSREAEGETAELVETPDAFQERLARTQNEFVQVKQKFESTLRALARFRSTLDSTPVEQAQRDLVVLLSDLSGELLELSLVQARARLDAVVLEVVDMDSAEAVEIARINRLDWMNARVALVDSWRLIEFNANALKAGLNVVFSGDISTIGDNPVRFRDTTGRLRAGLQFDAPLTRVSERNVYRQALIEYQQARRAYMQFEDQVHQTLRAELRQLELNQINFELRRAAVQVAINQVDLARLRLNQPPKPGETEQFSVTTARDLVSALSDLLNVENDFLSVWVNYEVTRLNLDFDLGTMQLDDRGLWIDPGPIQGNGLVCGPLDMEMYPELRDPEEGLEMILPGRTDVEELPGPEIGPKLHPAPTEGAKHDGGDKKQEEPGRRKSLVAWFRPLGSSSSERREKRDGASGAAADGLPEDTSNREAVPPQTDSS